MYNVTLCCFRIIIVVMETHQWIPFVLLTACSCQQCQTVGFWTWRATVDSCRLFSSYKILSCCCQYRSLWVFIFSAWEFCASLTIFQFCANLTIFEFCACLTTFEFCASLTIFEFSASLTIFEFCASLTMYLNFVRV